MRLAPPHNPAPPRSSAAPPAMIHERLMATYGGSKRMAERHRMRSDAPQAVATYGKRMAEAPLGRRKKRRRSDANPLRFPAFDLYHAPPGREVAKATLLALLDRRMRNLTQALAWKERQQAAVEDMTEEEDRLSHFGMRFAMGLCGKGQQWMRAEEALLEYRLAEFSSAGVRKLTVHAGARLTCQTPNECWLPFRWVAHLLREPAPSLCDAVEAEAAKKPLPHAAQQRWRRLSGMGASERKTWLEQLPDGGEQDKPLERMAQYVTEQARLLVRGEMWVVSSRHQRRALVNCLRQRMEQGLARVAAGPLPVLRAWTACRPWWCRLCRRLHPGDGPPCCGQGTPSWRLLKKLHRMAMDRNACGRWGKDGAVVVSRRTRRLGAGAIENLTSMGFVLISHTATTCTLRHPRFHPGYMDDGSICYQGEKMALRRHTQALLREMVDQCFPVDHVWRQWDRHFPDTTVHLAHQSSTLQRLHAMLRDSGAGDNAVHLCGGTFFCSRQGGGAGRYCPLKRGCHSSSNRGTLRLVPAQRDPKVLEVRYTCFSVGCKGSKLIGRIMAADL